MGEVYRPTATNLKRSVAITVLLDVRASSAGFEADVPRVSPRFP